MAGAAAQIISASAAAKVAAKRGAPVDLRERVRRELARRSLVDFTLYTYPTYQAGWFHRDVSDRLDRFLADVLAKRSPRLMLFAPPRSGKALAVDTPIPTPDGWRAIVDLRPGDVVFAGDGSRTRVVARSEVWRNRVLWRAIANSGQSVVADEAHEWLVRLDRKLKAWTRRETGWLAARASPVAALGGDLRFEPAGRGDTVCIEVEHSSHTFLAGRGMIPTCNSELVSRRFPAFALGRYPDLSFIATSYASELASRNNRDVQRVMDSSEYVNLFPGTRLFGANVRTTAHGTWLRNSDIFEVVNHRGVYRSAGVMAGITGMGFDVGLIDDPVKDAIEAESKVYRDRAWEWYTSTFYTRRAPGAGILLILTRWHEDDIAGRLLAAADKGEGEKWDVVRYPAIAEEDEPHRKKGEALHPERFSLKDMEATRLAVGSRVWTSLYQQRPTAAEGSIFKREHWRWFKWPTDDGKAPRTREEIQRVLKLLGVRRVVQSWDTAFKDKDESDFSSCCTMGERDTDYVVLESVKKRYEYPELKRDAMARAALWTPHVVLVEDKASGQSLIQELKRDTRLPVVAVKIDNDKVARANAVTPLHEAGRFALPEGDWWVLDFVDSLAAFPNGVHDDDVDAFDQAANYLARGGGGMGVWEFMREEHSRIEQERRERAAKAAAERRAGG